MTAAPSSARRKTGRVRRVDVETVSEARNLGRTDGYAWERGDWPARWVTCPGASSEPHVAAYRLAFPVTRRSHVRIRVAADERYTLYLDGVRFGRGNERGSPWRWHFETYDLDLAPGDHTLVARVWWLGESGPKAQMSVHEGFLLQAEGEWLKRLSTGLAPWAACLLPGYRFEGGPLNWGAGHDEVVDGRAVQRGWEWGRGSNWRPAVPGMPGADFETNNDRIGLVHRLAPAALPSQLDRLTHAGRVRHVAAVDAGSTRTRPVRASEHLSTEAARWQSWWRGGTLRIPPHTTRRAIVDLENYYCLYPQLTLRGGRGATVRLHWAESLYEAKPDPAMGDDHVWNRPKGNRDEIEGKYFIGHGPTWIAPGGRPLAFDTLWWQAGRYIEVLIQTGAEALALDAPILRETRYPLELESRCATDDARIEALQPVLVRGLQMCAHETYMDCPYWEQLMYAGDTRLQVLCNHVMNADDRLTRAALRMFDDSRLPSGLTQSRFPSANGQVIPPFSLHWISMLHDFARWRGDVDLVRELLPGVRAVLHAHLRHRRDDGLVAACPGWNFVDWVPGWRSGEPPGTAEGCSSSLMWQLVCALQDAAALEAHAGQNRHAANWRAEARALAAAVTAGFWDASRGLMADDLARSSFSEHAQCFALASGRLPGRSAARMLDQLDRGDVAPAATIYFSHYVLEALASGGRADGFFRRLELWKALPEQGFRTPYEAPGNTRSDCHAWASHPLFHLFASVGGIRPADFGFRTVEIRPLLGPLKRLDVELVHPLGRIGVSGRVGARGTRFEIRLPRGLSGHLVWKGRRHLLRGGRQEFKS